MSEIVEVQSPAALRRLRVFFESNIIGYDARRAERHLDEARRPVTALLPGSALGLYQSAPLAIHDADGRIMAAVHAHPPYEQIAELTSVHGADFARGVALTRRTLACLAVDPELRGNGYGRRVVTELEEQLRGEGVLHLQGFMDERNGPPSFYEQLGYTVFPRNTPIPPLRPYSFAETHPSYVSGQWFHKRL